MYTMRKDCGLIRRRKVISGETVSRDRFIKPSVIGGSKLNEQARKDRLINNKSNKCCRQALSVGAVPEQGVVEDRRNPRPGQG